MSVAEQLIAEGLNKGRIEGMEMGLEKGIEKGLEKGLWIGKIQTLEDFLGMTPSTSEVLDPLSVAELAAMHQGLHREYEQRFKQR